MSWNSGESVQFEKVVDCPAKGVVPEIADLLSPEPNVLLFACMRGDVRSASRLREAEVTRSRLGGSGSSLRYCGGLPLVALGGSVL